MESTLKLVPVVYLCKFEENPSIGSRDILPTRISTHLFKKYLILALKSTFLSWLVTLKMGSKSPKYSKLVRFSFRYSCASLVGIKTKMQEIYHF